VPHPGEGTFVGHTSWCRGYVARAIIDWPLFRLTTYVSHRKSIVISFFPLFPRLTCFAKSLQSQIQSDRFHCPCTVTVPSRMPRLLALNNGLALGSACCRSGTHQVRVVFLTLLYLLFTGYFTVVARARSLAVPVAAPPGTRSMS